MSTWVLVEDEPDIYEVVLELYGVWGNCPNLPWLTFAYSARFRELRWESGCAKARFCEKWRWSFLLPTDYEANVILKTKADKLSYKP